MRPYFKGYANYDRCKDAQKRSLHERLKGSWQRVRTARRVWCHKSHRREWFKDSGCGGGQIVERTTHKTQKGLKIIINCTTKRGLGIKMGAEARQEWVKK